ncbi:MAG: hypothetical protein J7545_17125 [Roseofilum sp. SBFL]|nr:MULTISPECIES: hypothetical protein [unclassified Roseofilum]MBP0014904.1 hypothetical protein [Roseofilum sp. SID3]MBP0022794.1 hypothetical protein [Roseofilum sp. SID2]MBP0043670.1 hypothetical protein [Roseofilum sp. SBFL]
MPKPYTLLEQEGWNRKIKLESKAPRQNPAKNPIMVQDRGQDGVSKT